MTVSTVMNAYCSPERPSSSARQANLLFSTRRGETLSPKGQVSSRFQRRYTMSESHTPEALNPLRLPIVFTPSAWQYAVLLEHSDHSEKLQIDRLSNVLRAAFEAHLAYPHEPYVLFDVVHIEPTDHLDHDPLLQLSLSLLQEPGQPDALLIAVAGEANAKRT
jgi:hypothetical protein